MSYCKPKGKSKTAAPFYPGKLMMFNGGILNTGPYQKSRCGETQKEVTEFIVHLIDKYEDYIKKNEVVEGSEL